MSLADDRMPDEGDVLEDFGFNNTSSYQDRTYLLGLYIGLYLSGGFSAEDLHEWRTGGILAEKIEEFYYGIPEKSRGGYFPWYLQNRHVLSRPGTEGEGSQHLIATFYDKVKSYLDVKDRNKTAKELKPEAKRDAYNLLATVSQQFMPNPSEKNWYSFRFVTCRGQDEENILAEIYRCLLLKNGGGFFPDFYESLRAHDQPVDFTQFWKAYEAGTLIQLMDTSSLEDSRSRLPFLEVFLSVPRACDRPSVWDLKWMLDINDPTNFTPILPVSVDYGFINCHTFEETCTLVEIYRRVFQNTSPLDLHQACIAGTLWQFVSGRIRMEERWRPLMKNVYSRVESTASEVNGNTQSRPGCETDREPVEFSPLLSRLLRSLGIF
ncbi:hypothetical protein AA0113_g595 [Alternaria arborescens]|uniref:Uncharacterized protein n=1 Tax=Alternaria arborescens TaxID=156630 RepID=A0A4Q4SPM2_9PLEO|nr:hypothetical protein AA0113_g595 [Alternaria arborescens]